MKQGQTIEPSRAARAEAEPAPGEAAEDPRARAASMLPADLLQPGEIIVLLLKPSAWFILLVPLRFLAVVALFTMATLWLDNVGATHIGRHDILSLAVLVCAIRLFWQFLEWMGRTYVLTDRRVIRVVGVARIRIFEASLNKIQHTNLTFSLRERFFGLGTISFATAGTGFTEAYWVMIPKPVETHQVVITTIERYR
ncbi:MAG: PH domain-containing protein [Planctomycetes bacterium]|nr:PH domain-containing protein [Planctomycetota bacterium]